MYMAYGVCYMARVWFVHTVCAYDVCIWCVYMVCECGVCVYGVGICCGYSIRYRQYTTFGVKFHVTHDWEQ